MHFFLYMMEKSADNCYEECIITIRINEKIKSKSFLLNRPTKKPSQIEICRLQDYLHVLKIFMKHLLVQRCYTKSDASITGILKIF